MLEDDRSAKLHVVPPPDSPWPPWAEQWLMPYLTDPMLVPVAIVILVHLAMVITLLVYMARQEFGFVAMGVLALLAGLSGRIAWTEVLWLKRPGRVTVFLALVWASGVALALGAHALGLD